MIEITWYGHACFRIKDKNTVVITDPYGRGLGYSFPRVKADIVTISLDHPHHSSMEGVKGEPKVIDGPGEYELNSIFITGLRFPGGGGKESDLQSTVYLFEFEDLTVCHLGGLATVPTPDQVEALGAMDVLLVPVGGHETLAAAEASEVIGLLEPRVVVPMHFATGVKGEPPLDPVEKFLKVMGVRNPAPQEVLKLGRAGTESTEETQVVLLEPKGRSE